MPAIIKKWALLVLALGIAAVVYIWLDGTPIAQVKDSRINERAGVPSPEPGQKKVILKDLGMT